MTYQEIESLEQFVDLCKQTDNLSFIAFQSINFSPEKELFQQVSFENCLFLGCKIPVSCLGNLYKGNSVFPELDVPYNCYPSSLYSCKSLYDNYVAGQPASYKKTFDAKVYSHYIKTGKEANSINETLARRLHDHAITDAMYDFISIYDEKKIVAIMGGHALRRDDTAYKKVALLAKQLCEKGFLMVSGGGPGAMEATHLGAWFAGCPDSDLEDAVGMLSSAPDYKHPNWLDTAFKTMEKYPNKGKFESLGIPTWLYGHEPATPFATKIAKYFANSVREDGLLTIAKGGVVFSPGSAGTVQEVFQDATQNHYQTFGYASPMVFLGKDFWTNKFPVYSFLENNLKTGNYKNLILSVSDDIPKIVDTLVSFSGS